MTLRRYCDNCGEDIDGRWFELVLVSDDGAQDPYAFVTGDFCSLQCLQSKITPSSTFVPFEDNTPFEIE